jgi:hypothetical protein
MPKNKNFTISEMYCTECGNKGIDIPRRAGQQREAGHLKRIYCLCCCKATNHAEVRPFGSYRYEDFKEEFDLGRFVNGEKLPISQLPGCKNLECKYNRNRIGKCWNTNCSCQCEFRNKEG